MIDLNFVYRHVTYTPDVPENEITSLINRDNWRVDFVARVLLPDGNYRAPLIRKDGK